MRDTLGWTPDDYAALVAMADNQGAPADWFAAVMMSESSMQPWARNPSGAQGLIQFANLGHDITGWTPAQQMPLVNQYYAPWRPSGGWVSRAQVYQVNYLPATVARLGSDPDTVLARQGDGLYQGAIFDHTGKGYTTVGDLETRLQDVTQGAKWNAALAGIAAAGGSLSSTSSPTHPLVIVAGGLALGMFGTYLYANRHHVLPAYIFRHASENPITSRVQTVIFNRDQWTPRKARAWLTQHGYRAGKMDVPASGASLRFRQEPPLHFKRMRTIPFGHAGIQAVIGFR